jgi:hypothetical protein
MTPMFSMPFTSPWMEGSSNYVLTVVFFYGTLFVTVVCVFCPFEKTCRSSAVPFVVDKSCWGVIISYHVL